MKIILMNVPAHGHVNPTLPVVQGLIAQGVHVLYYNAEEFRTKISTTGAEFRAYPLNCITPEAITRAVATHLINMTQLLLEASLTLTAFMLDEIAREEPDLLLFDSICLWGMQTARISGLPSVSSITTFVLEGIKLQLPWRDRWHMIGGALPRMPKLLGTRHALVQRYGRASLPTNYLFPCTGQLNLVYTTPALQPPSPIIDASFLFVGPALTPHAQVLDFVLPAGRVIYISLGTIHTNHADFYAHCFEAFADAPGTFVMAAGALADQLTAPPNFIMRPHVPQLALLSRADLFITHAGINSLHESLYFGVPMVMVPQQMEQALNARVAARHNLGVVVSGEPPYGQHVSAEILAAAVETVLTDARYAAAAQRMKGELQATGGAAQAVAAIVEFGVKSGATLHLAESSRA